MDTKTLLACESRAAAFARDRHEEVVSGSPAKTIHRIVARKRCRAVPRMLVECHRGRSTQWRHSAARRSCEPGIQTPQRCASSPGFRVRANTRALE
jgi:hypothetical protein